MTWDWQYAWEVLPDLLEGLRTTVTLTAAASIIALVLGLLLAIVRHVGVPVLAPAARWYMQFFRNTPLLVQLYLFFFALPEIGIYTSAITSGVLVLGLHTASYMSEVYRAGITAISQGQWDACVALNLPRWRVWQRVIIPQALPPIVPPLANYMNEMFKLTAYVAIIGGIELFGQGLRVAELTYRYLVPLSMVGLLYLVVSVSLSVAIRRLEARGGRVAAARSGLGG